MIEQLKELDTGISVIFNTDDIVVLTEVDEMNIISIKVCSADDSEFVVIELNDAYLVAHNFDIDPRYFIYQIFDSGSAEDLEQDGYYFLTEDQDFRSKIVFRDDNRGHIYKHSEVGAVYDINDDEETNVSICEYVSNSHELSHMLVIKQEEDELLILQGIEIDIEDVTIEGLVSD